MTIDIAASKSGKSTRTVKRWIESYNKINGTNFENGENAIISDPQLLAFIKSKFPIQVAGSTISKEQKKSIPVKKTVRECTPAKPKRKTIQQRLSSDWLVGLVLAIILFADVFAFSVIGDHEFGEKFSLSFAFFGVMGFATGVGSMISYSRIQDEKLSNAWKWFFGVLQFSVFFLATNEFWIAAEVVMTAMFVFVSMGVQRSIKK